MKPLALTWLERLITPALAAVDGRLGKPVLNSPGARVLLLGTVAHESEGFRWPCQNGGPALGYFNIELPTALDIIQRTEEHYPAIYAAAAPFLAGDPEDIKQGLIFNLDSQVVIARLIYYFAPGRLPVVNDLKGQAALWKLTYNTAAGTEKQYTDNWNRHVAN